MTADDLGPWSPLPVAEVVALLSGAPFRWWICGGHALELHLGRSWRAHADVDVGIVRSEFPAVSRWLSGYTIQIAAAGQLYAWDGRPLSAARHENNAWARRGPKSPWALDLTIGDGDAREWVYRRDPMIRRPWGAAVLRGAEGVPYLAPELQLLFKARAPRPKDTRDAELVIPALDEQAVRFLRRHLPDGHSWRRLFR